MNPTDIGPDIEIEADEWVANQAALEEDAYAGINSCDALRIIDGVSMIQENE